MKNIKFRNIKPTELDDDFLLEIHVTEMCNYSCSYCNLSPMNKHTVIDYEKLFSVALPANSRIFLLGGEPTIDKHFFDLIEQCYERGYTKIDVQTNLTFNPQSMVEKLLARKTPVKFYCSYHMEFSKFDTFLKKCIYLKENKMFGGIHLMWMNKFDRKCLNYYKIMNNVVGNVSLEPTLPKSLDDRDWDVKVELSQFIKNGYLSKCNRLRKVIKIDGKSITIGEALINNFERDIYKKKCYAPSHTLVFSINKNKFYNCTFDLLFDRECNPKTRNNKHCTCLNKICCGDLEFKKI